MHRDGLVKITEQAVSEQKPRSKGNMVYSKTFCEVGRGGVTHLRASCPEGGSSSGWRCSRGSMHGGRQKGRYWAVFLQNKKHK